MTNHITTGNETGVG